MTITVANRKECPPDGKTKVYVGRPTALGNPFRIGKDGSRSQVIAKYEAWLYGELGSTEGAERRAFDALLLKAKTGDLTLVCHCAPLACHADVIARHLREALETSA